MRHALCAVARCVSIMLLIVLFIGCAASERTQSSLVEASVASEDSSGLNGTWKGTYYSPPIGQADVTLTFTVTGASYTGTFSTSTGAYGTTQGSISGNHYSGSAKQNTPTCPGPYIMKGSWSGSATAWTFCGNDCMGKEDGHGYATHQN